MTLQPLIITNQINLLMLYKTITLHVIEILTFLVYCLCYSEEDDYDNLDDLDDSYSLEDLED